MGPGLGGFVGEVEDLSWHFTPTPREPREPCRGGAGGVKGVEGAFGVLDLEGPFWLFGRDERS